MKGMSFRLTEIEAKALKAIAKRKGITQVGLLREILREEASSMMQGGASYVQALNKIIKGEK